ncbi:MAG: acyl-CoA dehydrogenase family protein [Chloroflexota bacterium]|nr:acyl-CoA dehydrogenase family protein [Chloroflexota bacterium]
MEYTLSQEELFLRQEISAFAKTELPQDWIGFGVLEEYGDDKAWELSQYIVKKLALKGWLAMAWPKKYGGSEASPMEQAIYREEMAYWRVPGIDVGPAGIPIVGPTLMTFGTEEQKQEHLPKIASGEETWTLLYSEPNSGSDLASIQCHAMENNDHFTIYGEKIWVTGGNRCDWCMLAAQTTPDAPRHEGISLLLVNLKYKGLRVKPLTSLTGYQENTQIFLDGVQVPKSNLIGEKNRGWYYIMVALDFERTFGIGFVGCARRMLDELVNYTREEERNVGTLGKPSTIRSSLAEMAIECEVARLLCYRVAWMQEKGIVPNYEVSMAKNLSAEMCQRVANVGMQIIGPYSQLRPGSKWAQIQGVITRNYLYTVTHTIYMGTSEINRNIIALRGLGLPRG